MLKLKLPYSGHLVWRANSLEKILMLGKTEGKRRRGRQRMRWMASPTQWTVWANSGRQSRSFSRKIINYNTAWALVLAATQLTRSRPPAITLQWLLGCPTLTPIREPAFFETTNGCGRSNPHPPNSTLSRSWGRCATVRAWRWRQWLLHAMRMRMRLRNIKSFPPPPPPLAQDRCAWHQWRGGQTRLCEAHPGDWGLEGLTP